MPCASSSSKINTSGASWASSYAEAFKSRSPLLVVDPTLFLKTPFG
ncbi:MAG: hypothetical protein HY654_08835 [Acidobacteria bacterium]|nr:hypothetical protein [Acidobacteriota bacterium]